MFWRLVLVSLFLRLLDKNTIWHCFYCPFDEKETVVYDVKKKPQHPMGWAILRFCYVKQYSRS